MSNMWWICLQKKANFWEVVNRAVCAGFSSASESEIKWAWHWWVACGSCVGVPNVFSILTKNKTKKHISRYMKLSRWKHLESKGKKIWAIRHEAECTLGWNRPARDQVCKCMKHIISTWAMSRHSTMCKHCQEHVTLVLFILKCTCTTACARITSALIIHRSDKWCLIAAMLCGEHSGDSLAL